MSQFAALPVQEPSPSVILQAGASALGNGVTLAVAGKSVVLLTVSGAGGPNAIVTFEGTEDGTSFQALIAANLGTAVQGTAASVSATPTLYVCSVGGLNGLRARISTYVAGTVTVTAHATLASYAPRVVQVSDGTTQVSVQAIASGQNAATVAGGYKELSGLSAGSLNADLVPSTDVSAYKWLSLHILTVASGTYTIQGSNDNATWTTVLMQSRATSTGPWVGSGSTALLFAGPIDFRYLRVRQTSYSSGTTTGVLELYSMAPGATSSQQVAAQISNVARTVSATGSNSLDTSFGAVTLKSAKGANAQIFGFDVSSVGGALVYFQIFNKATAPALNDVPVYSIALAAGTATVPARLALTEAFFGIAGRNLTTGLAWGISSTAATFTDAGTAGNYQVHVHYA